MAVVKVMESKSCRCSSVILVCVTLSITLALVIIQCSVIVQLQTMKADVARIKEKQRRHDLDTIQSPLKYISQVSDCIVQ